MHLRPAAIANVLFAVCFSRALLGGEEPAAFDAELRRPVSSPSESIGISGLSENYGDFELLSEKQLLLDVAIRSPLLRIPRLDDDFNRADSPTLGNHWRTGTEGPGASIGVRDHQAVARGLNVAFMDEPVPSPNARFTVRITSVDAQSEAGLIFRATEPDGVQGHLDHEFVRVRGDGVIIGSVQSGVQTLAPVVPFHAEFPLVLAVTAFGTEIRVAVDGREIAVVYQSPLPGRLAGLWASGDIKFDDFQASSFNRPVLPRNYFDNVRCTPSPFVTYRPIYGQHVMIERYGQHFGNCVQPVIEQLKFGVDTALLPIRAMRYPPWYCDSNACYYPPGVPVCPLRFTISN